MIGAMLSSGPASMFGAIATSLPNTLLAGMVVTVAALLIARFVGRGNPRLRFTVWMVALAAMAVLPFVGLASKTQEPRPAGTSIAVVTLSASVAAYVLAAWMLGAAIGLTHIALGVMRLRRVRKNSKPVDVNELDPVPRATLEEAQQHRAVTLCVSDAVSVPSAIGYFQPMVVMPGWVLAEIPADELNSILLHELAHLRRYHDWTNLAQKMIKAVFFFHPAVWYIESQLTLEREMACDEAVLAANFSPRDYAESLVSLAERSFLHRGIELAQAAVGHVKQLRLRLVEILRRDRQGSVRTRKSAVAILAVAAVVSTFAVSRAPLLVRFSADNTATRTARISSPQSAIEPHLQPVSLKYTDHPQPATPLHALAPARVQPRHHKTPKGGPAFIKRVAVNSIPAELPIPALLLANFPIELTPAPVVMVFQGGELGRDGPVLWRVTLFRLSTVQ